MAEARQMARLMPATIRFNFRWRSSRRARAGPRQLTNASAGGRRPGLAARRTGREQRRDRRQRIPSDLQFGGEFMHLVQFDFDLGNGHGVDDEAQEVHHVVPDPIEGGGVFRAIKRIRQPPGDGRHQCHENSRPASEVPGHQPDRDGINDEEAQLIARGIIHPAQQQQREQATNEDRATFPPVPAGVARHRPRCGDRLFGSSHAFIVTRRAGESSAALFALLEKARRGFHPWIKAASLSVRRYGRDIPIQRVPPNVTACLPPFHRVLWRRPSLAPVPRHSPPRSTFLVPRPSPLSSLSPRGLWPWDRNRGW